MGNVTEISPMDFVFQVIHQASLADRAKILEQIAFSLRKDELHNSGQASSNLAESAQFCADAAFNIEATVPLIKIKPCICGECDDCVAAASDVSHDRKRDLVLVK